MPVSNQTLTAEIYVYVIVPGGIPFAALALGNYALRPTASMMRPLPSTKPFILTFGIRNTASRRHV